MGFDGNQRNSFRAPIIDRCEGTLRCSDAQIHVLVLDQSATGFKLATEDQRPISKTTRALLDFDDGVVHVVQIRRVEQDGSVQTLGLEVVETRVRRPNDFTPSTSDRRAAFAKIGVALLLVVASICALQASPVQNRLAGFTLFPENFSSNAVDRQRTDLAATPTASAIGLGRPFELSKYLKDDVAEWLELSKSQRTLMRGVLQLCSGARSNRSAAAERACVDFAAEASILGLLRAEQRSRLEEKFNQPLTPSALLQDVIKRYSAQLSPEELVRVFGALLPASPELARRYGISEEVAAAVRETIDGAYRTSPDHVLNSGDNVEAEEIVLDYLLRMEQLKTTCAKLIDAESRQVAR